MALPKSSTSPKTDAGSRPSPLAVRTFPCAAEMLSLKEAIRKLHVSLNVPWTSLYPSLPLPFCLVQRLSSLRMTSLAAESALLRPKTGQIIHWWLLWLFPPPPRVKIITFRGCFFLFKSEVSVSSTARLTEMYPIRFFVILFRPLSLSVLS